MVTNSEVTGSGRKLTYLNRRHYPSQDNQFICESQNLQNSQCQWTESGKSVHE